MRTVGLFNCHRKLATIRCPQLRLLGHSARGQAALEAGAALLASAPRSSRVLEARLAIGLRQHAVDAHHPVLAGEDLLEVPEPAGRRAHGFRVYA